MNKLLAVFCLAVLSAGCQKIEESDPEAVVSIRLQGHFREIDSAVAELYLSDRLTQTRVLQKESDSVILGSFSEVGEGSGQRVVIRLFDGLIIKYLGAADFDVNNSEPIDLMVTLLPVEQLDSTRPYWDPGLRCDTAGGNYTLTWNDYPDYDEFINGLKGTYVVVKDTLPIINQYIYNASNLVDRKRFGEAGLTRPLPEECELFFGIFIFSEKFRVYIKTGDWVYKMFRPCGT
jgi:hypothetical protein